MPKSFRRSASLLAVLVASVSALAVGAASPAAAATYLTKAQIANVSYGQCLQAYYINNGAGAGSCTSDSYRLWKIYQVGTDPYGSRIVQLRNARTGGCLSATGKFDDAYITTQTCGTSYNNWIWHGGSSGGGSYGTTFQLNGTTLYLGLNQLCCGTGYQATLHGWYNSAYHQTWNAYPA